MGPSPSASRTNSSPQTRRALVLSDRVSGTCNSSSMILHAIFDGTCFLPTAKTQRKKERSRERSKDIKWSVQAGKRDSFLCGAALDENNNYAKIKYDSIFREEWIHNYKSNAHFTCSSGFSTRSRVSYEECLTRFNNKTQFLRKT